MLTRRIFLSTATAWLTMPSLSARVQRSEEWGSPIFDLHFHLRARPADNVAHLDGAGIAKANLLTRAAAADRIRELQSASPGRFIWFASADITQPDGVETLTQAIKGGAQGFGEIKSHAATDSPEFRRAYALAADLNVPILIHFQEVDHFPNEGTWSSGFATKFEAVLKASPRRRSLVTPTRSGPTSAPITATRRRIRRDRSSAAASRIGCLATIQISMAICRRILGTTCCRVMPSSHATS